MNVPPHHPLLELLGSLLLGIEVVPPNEQRRMVNRACKEAVKFHEEEIKELKAEIKRLQEVILAELAKDAQDLDMGY